MVAAIRAKREGVWCILPQPQAVLVGLRGPDGHVPAVPVDLSTSRSGRHPLTCGISTSRASSMASITRSIRMLLLGLQAAGPLLDVHLVPPRPGRPGTRPGCWGGRGRPVAAERLPAAATRSRQDQAGHSSRCRTADLQRDALLIGVDHSYFMLQRGWRPTPAGRRLFLGGIRRPPADRAPPVPGLGEGPVDAGRGRPRRSGIAHGVLRVQLRRDFPARLGDVVEADPAVGVHDDLAARPARRPPRSSTPSRSISMALSTGSIRLATLAVSAVPLARCPIPRVQGLPPS